MSGLVTRRTLIAGGVAAAGLGAAGFSASRYGLIPPNLGGFLGAGETLTYSAQRLLTAGQPLAREFPKSRISKIAPVNGLPPVTDDYRRWLTDGFDSWRLSVEGLVEHPLSLSLGDVKRLPMESHVTLHACEEGWSYIAEWTGVRLSAILDLAGTRPEARYVVFEPFENPNQNTGAVRVLWDSIDMADALHPQTLLAYGMNDEALSPGHGAPLRLRLARHLGYKNTKYLSRIRVVDASARLRDPVRRGPWYGGI